MGRISVIKGLENSNQAHNNTARHIEEIFGNHKSDLNEIIDLSQKVKKGIQVIDPFLQQNTSIVCPGCNKVCCIDQHSYYSCEDLIYIYSLGLEVQECESIDVTAPCRFLSSEGCRLERAVRPSGCNWYFCDSLYDSMEKSPGSAYYDFNDSLQELTDLWMELVNEFCCKFKKLTGNEMRIEDLMSSSKRRIT